VAELREVIQLQVLQVTKTNTYIRDALKAASDVLQTQQHDAAKLLGDACVYALVVDTLFARSELVPFLDIIHMHMQLGHRQRTVAIFG
jgi:uncharacterized protein with PIN domain